MADLSRERTSFVNSRMEDREVRSSGRKVKGIDWVVRVWESAVESADLGLRAVRRKWMLWALYRWRMIFIAAVPRVPAAPVMRIVLDMFGWRPSVFLLEGKRRELNSHFESLVCD